jgi:hypothetical protein
MTTTAREDTRLRAGDVVEVKSASEILATLDEDGRVDGLPFMPEMLQFCGKKIQVRSRAHKTCDTIQASGFRRMEDAVHLDDLRCDGSAHDGCQAACLIFWKSAWLRRVDEPSPAAEDADVADPAALERLAATTRGPDTPSGEPTYSCQATELRAATCPLPWWHARQYAEDVESGNVPPRRLVRGLVILLFNKFQAANRRFVPRLTLVSGGRRYPFVAGRLEGSTPVQTLDLQPGELVRIKSKEEIEETLDRNNRNRGLLFDGVMSKYCGQTATVRSRVWKIINEETGTMRHFKTACVMLEGVTCTGDYMQFCPRRIYDYWREIWLDRV